MNTAKKVMYTVKLIDEYGQCYAEEEMGFLDRLAFTKEWLGKEGYSKSMVGDIVILIKYTGEELWFYESSKL